jgi:PAS domain S-box-containing protein
MLDLEEPIQRSGETRILLTSKVPLQDGQGNTIGVAGIFTDITERKHIEKALEEASRVAQSAA